MRVVIWILLAVVVVATVKALRYFYALCGVLHYVCTRITTNFWMRNLTMTTCLSTFKKLLP